MEVLYRLPQGEELEEKEYEEGGTKRNHIVEVFADADLGLRQASKVLNEFRFDLCRWDTYHEFF